MSLTKNLYILIIVQLISFWAAHATYAQKKTELDSVKIKAYAEDGSYIGSPNDSSIYKFHQYNPALSGNNFYAYGGNIGLSARNIEFVLPDFGFTGLKNNFAIWDFSNQPIGYYNTTRPFTNVQVVFGSKRELVSRVFHTQNINPHTNIGVEIKSLQSEGFATRQQTNILNSRLFFAYQPTSIRYNVQANWDWGRVANQENGGVNSDSSFQYLIEADPRLVPTYLPNSITNKVGGTFTSFQYINLGEKTKETIDSVAVTKIKAKSRFFHRFSYSDYTNLYSDVFTIPVLDVYKNYYFDSLLTREQIQTIQATNEIGWDNSARYQKDSSSFFLKLSLAHAYVDYQQREINKFYDNVWINAQIKKRLGIKNELFFNSSFMAAGYNSNDYRIFAGIRNNNDSSKINYKVAVFSQLQHPDQIISEYSSNHFKWTNAFKQQLYNGVSGFIQYKKQSAEINYYIVSDFIYFDQYTTPAQYNSSVQVVSAKLNSDFKLGKIYFSNVALVQKSLAGTSVTRLPLLCSRHTIYFQKILFKKTTPFQGGIEINYNSAYMANAYMPSSNQFYLQNKQRIGNYAVLDVFLSFRIRSAKVFVKSEHVNNMLLAGNYFLVPFNPMHDRSFKVGISWSFVN